MRVVWTAVLVSSAIFTGCGYIGPVVPPSPEIPMPITNLAVVERGDQLYITFNAPMRTSDDLGIKMFSEVDLGIGPATVPFDFERWSGKATHYELPTPAPRKDPDDPTPRPMSKVLPAAQWEGQRIAVLVRTAIKKNEHYSQWSNRIVMEVTAPIKPPEIAVKATKEGYMVTWSNEETGFHYHILRAGPSDKSPVEVGVADESPYVDATSQWDTPYRYEVVKQKDSVESLPSKPFEIVSADVFPPAVPASITSLAGPDSIEVSWSRSPDTDLKGYYVYRSEGGGAWQKLGDLVTLPTFSDHSVQHGKTYRYAVSAIDQKGNESEKSTPTEVTF